MDTATTLVALRPLSDRLIVKKIEAEEKTAGGIVLPDIAKEKPVQADVLAVGPGRLNDKGERFPIDIKVGDRVLFAKYGGVETKVNGVDYLVLSEKDVLAIVTK